jgi:succinyl-CoA synthetase beta subunit
VLVGGRGKAGGIRIAKSPEEAKEIASDLIGSNLKGLRIKKLLIEEAMDIAKEIYVGVVMDRSKNSPLIMISAEGGVDIEELAEKAPEKIASMYVDVFRGLRDYEARKLVKQVGFGGKTILYLGSIIKKLYSLFMAYDAELAEINPLIITKTGQLKAIDAKLNIDDHALFRHKELNPSNSERFENPLEFEGHLRGANYVDLDGSVCVLGNGAGLTMALIDMLRVKGLEPACFLDTGGGLSRERMRKAFELLLIKAKSDPRVKAILFSISLQITPAEAAANGIFDVAKDDKSKLFIAGAIHGTEAEKAKEILKETKVKLCSDAKEAIELIAKNVGTD